jgi:hypothetical protein
MIAARAGRIRYGVAENGAQCDAGSLQGSDRALIIAFRLTTVDVRNPRGAGERFETGDPTS